jgi:nitroreductase
MKPIAESTLSDALNWRYAVKLFDPSRKIPEATWTALEQSLILSPSSFGLQPWKFIVVKDAALRSKLREHSWSQPQIVDASHLVVFARRTRQTRADVQRLIDKMVEVRNIPAASLDGYKGMMLGFIEKPASGFDAGVWASRQAYLALGVFLTAAAALGVDACPMEGIIAPKYDELLGLAGTGYTTQVVATAGYRSDKDDLGRAAKVRFDHAEVIEYR